MSDQKDNLTAIVEGVWMRETIKSDLFEQVDKAEKWDLIVSNPPYLSKKDLRNAQEELYFEPQEALYGGKEGLDFYKKIIPAAHLRLRDNGYLVLEVGAGQAGVVSTWLQHEGYVNIQLFKDYLGIERVVTAQIRKGEDF